jgi:hypothetical protein
MQGKSNRAFRRTARVAVGVLAASAITFAATAPGTQAQEDASFSPGNGTAIALVYKVNPIFGNLSFGITAGESVAGHQNTAATAQSAAIDLGVIGVTLAGEGCKGAAPTLPSNQQPQPLVVSSDDPGAAQGKEATLLGAPNVITMRSRATKAPFSQATTTVLDVGGAGGVVLNGGTATATSGVVKAGVRQAKAVTDINQVDLFNGLISLQGMHWEATQQTGKETVSSGKFTLGSIHVAGLAIPLPDDALDQLNALHDVLGSLGVTIDPPKMREASGVVFVDPLRIGIVPSTARDTLIGGLLGALQPVRDNVVGLINQIGCDGNPNILGNNGKTAVTVLDLVLGSVSGAGSLTVELGGVQATTAEIDGFQGLGVIPPLPGSTDGGTGVADLSGTDSGSLPDLSGTDSSSTGGSTATGGDAGTKKPISDTDDDGKRGGALAAIGGGGLLLLLLTAEADRRKMRRAQREIPVEA